MSNFTQTLPINPPIRPPIPPAIAPISDQNSHHFEHRVRQLSERSVTKYYQAYRDIDWQAHPIDPGDPNFELDDAHPLASSPWYQALPQAERALIGLDLVVSSMKIGVAFENVLQRGLLELALTLPDGDPSFRYAYHEVIEEGQHSLMFQEFINRAGRPSGRMGGFEQRLTRFVVSLGHRFPELFMLFVLGGEEPIDHDQRRALQHRKRLHPLLARIMQIHVTEEARHLCFARGWLQDRVPALSPLRRLALTLAAPVLLGFMARTMLEPPTNVIARHAIPKHVIDAAYHNNPAHQAAVRESLSGVTELCRELGLAPSWARFLWRWV
jgi:hypothetical protein